MTTSLVLDILIICLLAASTAYCFLLNRRLGNLRQGQEEFLKLINRFDDATLRAESNIDRLRGVAAEIDESLGERITTARGLRDELTFLIEHAPATPQRSKTKAAPSSKAPPGFLARDNALGSLVESDLLEALREARKG